MLSDDADGEASGSRGFRGLDCEVDTPFDDLWMAAWGAAEGCAVSRDRDSLLDCAVTWFS